MDHLRIPDRKTISIGGKAITFEIVLKSTNGVSLDVAGLEHLCIIHKCIVGKFNDLVHGRYSCFLEYFVFEGGKAIC